MKASQKTRSLDRTELDPQFPAVSGFMSVPSVRSKDLVETQNIMFIRSSHKERLIVSISLPLFRILL